MKTLDFGGKDEAAISALGLKSWFYREVEHWKFREIGHKLDVDYRNVPSYVKRFRENYKILFDIVKKVGERPLVPEWKSMRDIKARIQRAGGGGHTPRGLEWKRVEGKKYYVPSKNPEDVKLVQDLFLRADRGDGLGQLFQDFRDFHLAKRTITYMLQNLNYRKPLIDPLDPALFNRVQERVKEWRYKWRELYGVLCLDENGDPVWDEAKSIELTEAVNDRLSGSSWREVGKKRGWPDVTTMKRLKNPYVCGMRWSNGKLVRAHNKPLVSVKTWRAAMKVKGKQKGGDLKRELQKNIRTLVLGCFSNEKNGPGLTKPEIKKKIIEKMKVINPSFRISMSAIKTHLRWLDEKGIVVHDGPFWRRKF